MKKIVCALAVALVLCPIANAAKKLDIIKIQIAAQTEDRAFKYRNAGLIGAFQGTKTTDLVFMVNAVINGDHARLKCYENHRGCTALGPGEYDAEVKKDNVWIITEMPVTHKVIRDHWKVVGSW